MISNRVELNFLHHMFEANAWMTLQKLTQAQFDASRT